MLRRHPATDRCHLRAGMGRIFAGSDVQHPFFESDRMADAPAIGGLVDECVCLSVGKREPSGSFGPIV